MKNKFLISFFLIISTLITGCSQTSDEVKTSEPSNIIRNQFSIDENLKKEVEANHSFENPFVALDPYDNAPLSALVIFSTPEDTKVKVKVKGHEEAYDIEKEFGKNSKHIIPVYGLYPGEENTVLLSLDSGQTKELKITTEPIEDSFARVDIINKQEEKMKEGLTFVSLAMKSAENLVAMAYDNNGDIRWALKSNASAWDIYKLKNGRLLVSTSEKTKDPYYTSGVREIDFMGKAYVEYIIPGGYHHSAVELPNGNLLIAAQEDEAPTLEDVVFEINRSTGAIERTFDLKDVLPMDDGASLSFLSNDWFHNNAVWFDEERNSILLSGRNADAVVSLDYETGKLQWILGDPEGWTKVDKKYFFTPIGDNFEWQYAQHASMFTPEGNVFLFDNGPFRAKKTNEVEKLTGDDNYSRGVIYKIDENNMTIEQVWQFGKERGPKWYSFFVGDVDYLSENHFLINSGGLLYDKAQNSHEVGLSHIMNPDTQKTASIVEIKENEVIFEINTNFNIYAAERMNVYTDIDKFDLFSVGYILDATK